MEVKDNVVTCQRAQYSYPGQKYSSKLQDCRYNHKNEVKPKSASVYLHLFKNNLFICLLASGVPFECLALSLLVGGCDM